MEKMLIKFLLGVVTLMTAKVGLACDAMYLCEKSGDSRRIAILITAEKVIGVEIEQVPLRMPQGYYDDQIVYGDNETAYVDVKDRRIIVPKSLAHVEIMESGSAVRYECAKDLSHK